MTHRIVVLALLFVLCAFVLGGCGGGSESPANAKASRESKVCFEQAEELAETQGADAGEKHLEGCVSSYANEAQVEE